MTFLATSKGACAGEYNTLKKLADGMRDPNTGSCTAISSSLDLSAIRAFVTDVPDGAKDRSAPFNQLRPK
jgi:hypothetical protein